MHSLKEFSGPLACDVIRDIDIFEHTYKMMQHAKKNVIHVDESGKVVIVVLKLWKNYTTFRLSEDHKLHLAASSHA